VPKTFVVKRGKIGMYLKDLLHDIRDLMHPYTAAKLKESKKNTIKDFISAAGLFGVSHMLMLTQTEIANYLRIIKNPRGPTISFRIYNYTLARDVIKFVQETKKNSKIFSTTLQTPPLLIMNGFSARPEGDPMRIVSLMIQSMFPPLKVQSMNLSTCKRIVLFNLTENNDIEFRHYGLSARQRAINRSIKKLVNKNKVPNLSKFNDIADYVLHHGRGYRNDGGYSSESEIDDLPGSKIELPDDFQDKKKNTNVALRLHELGPRMNLKLIKIEEGICKGNVVHHEFIKLTPAQIKKQADSLKNKRELKEARKKEQEENVRRKAEKRGEL
jgi:ribosome biogenesis protein SSF1/2